MPWRGLVYLALIAPLHFILLNISALVVMVFMSPASVLHVLLTSVTFCFILWWTVPAFARVLSLQAVAKRSAYFRIFAILAGVGFFLTGFAAIMAGLATAPEAFLLVAAALICTHTWLIRTDLRR